MEEVDKLGTRIEREERQAALRMIEDDPPNPGGKGPWPTDDKERWKIEPVKLYVCLPTFCN